MTELTPFLESVLDDVAANAPRYMSLADGVTETVTFQNGRSVQWTLQRRTYESKTSEFGDSVLMSLPVLMSLYSNERRRGRRGH